MLKDEIEKLIRNRYLWDYVHDGRTKLHNDQNETEPHREIRTIFGRPHFTGQMRGAQNRYVREARDRSLTNTDSLDKWPTKQFRGEVDDITFSDRDVCYVHHPHCDALVFTAMVANNNVHRMLVDNGSSIDILYYQAFQRKGLKVSDLKPSPNLIYGFTGDSVTPWV